MKTLFVYQIIDILSEGILRTFFGPNDRFAENLFAQFCNSDGMKSADVSDIVLVRCKDNEHVFDSYNDYVENFDKSGGSFLYFGNDLIFDQEKKDES